MLDISFIRENPDKVKDGIVKKGYSPVLVERVLELDKKRVELLQKVDELRGERNKISKERTTDGSTSSPQDNEQRGREIKEELKKLEPQLNQIEDEYKKALWGIPNIIAPDVPEGKNETENKVLRKWGEPKKFDFEPKEHLDLGEALGIIDVKTAAKVLGSRSGYLKGEAALLEFALVQYALGVLTNEKVVKELAEKAGVSPKTFIPVIPPVMIRPDVFDKMARLQPTEERYYIESDDLYLIGSAEHTLGPMHMDETFVEKDLPIRYVGFSTSFRREAGSYGKDTRGIMRVHQFDKVEMESFSLPEDGGKEQDFFIAIQEYLMQSLELPYQVVAICAGDMGGPNYRQVDIETWLPGQNRYRETHTSDYMTDYQSRRLNTKVQRKGTAEFVYMNDATVLAIGRTIIAILENYQQKDGSVVVPEVLRPYMGKDKITAK